MPPAARGQLLMKLADLVERDLEQIAQIESLDNGKPMMLARGDVGYAAACFRYYGGWADKVVVLVIAYVDVDFLGCWADS